MRKIGKMKLLDIIDNWKLDIATVLGSATSGLMYTLEHYGAAIGILLPTLISAVFAIRKHLLDEKLANELHKEKLKEMRERHDQEMRQDEEEFRQTGKNNK